MISLSARITKYTPYMTSLTHKLMTVISNIFLLFFVPFWAKEIMLKTKENRATIQMMVLIPLLDNKSSHDDIQGLFTRQIILCFLYKQQTR